MNQVHQFEVSGMTCNGCAESVKRVLSCVPGVTGVEISLQDAKASVSMKERVPTIALQEALKKTAYRLSEEGHTIQQTFWNDNSVWLRASMNTLNCLIGCSIGDFGMVLYLQAYYLQVSMTLQMMLATVAGLITSVALETILLHAREKFDWKTALQTAFSMSFISMIAMELVMNATDFMITGGKAAFGNPMYWTALVIAMIAGFLAPLPYNYYRLKKYNLACH